MHYKKVENKIMTWLNYIKDRKQHIIELPALRFSDYIKPIVDTQWALANQALNQISNPARRELVETVFYSSLAFASAGSAIGSVTGPKGLLMGAFVGALLGLISAFIVLAMAQERKREQVS